ncbi:hypothetical protein ACD589_36045 [Rhizobium sp. 814_E9_N1_1]|uniref:hypothetical protein n=1 Tax=unclassified Rhizobium TaxID=2613769 RepID=UPI003F249C94
MLEHVFPQLLSPGRLDAHPSSTSILRVLVKPGRGPCATSRSVCLQISYGHSPKYHPSRK